MAGLAPILDAGLRVVFCGTAVGERSAARGHYYAGPGNEFWRLLDESGLIPEPLSPEGDHRLPQFGLGLTDLAPGVTQSHDRGLRYDVPALVRVCEELEPRFVAFTSLEGARAAARHLGHPKPYLGLQDWTVGSSRVFVVPSPSAANRRRDYSGRSSRLDWWRELASLASA